MTTWYDVRYASSHSYLDPLDICWGESGGVSSESSAGSQLNSYDNGHTYGESTNEFGQHSCPVQGLVSAAVIGMIPVESILVEPGIESYLETPKSQRRENGNENSVSPHALARRRAQNRASQRAFRRRKEKHVKDVKEKLADLQERHMELIHSYEVLQLEYSAVIQEIQVLRSSEKNIPAAQEAIYPVLRSGMCDGTTGGLYSL